MCFVQVGINIKTPRATLDVVKSNQITFLDGLMPPVLTKAEVISRDQKYLEPQKGAIVYVTSIGSVGTTSKTSNIIRLLLCKYLAIQICLAQKNCCNKK